MLSALDLKKRLKWPSLSRRLTVSPGILRFRRFISAAFPRFRLEALFLAREALVEMDVPTRQSYVASLVAPHERSFASAVTNLAWNVCWAIGSATAGLLMQNFAFSTPLFVGGGTKVAYDLLLYRSFHRLKPPEEKSLSDRATSLLN
jgi:predicted MFS family arabinose efflux permease